MKIGRNYVRWGKLQYSRHSKTTVIKGLCFLIEGIRYVTYHNKTIILLYQKHNKSIQFLTPYYGHKICGECYTVVFLT